MAEKKVKITMYYTGSQVTKPITYHFVKDFNLMINILHADISLNRIGKLTVDLTGEEHDIEAALDFLEKEGIEYKLFNKSIIWQEEGCVHCGACTAVCPSGALKMDPETWMLTFDREKCLVCELCVKACPLKVMNVTI